MNYYKYSYKNSVVVISTLIILVLIIFIPIKIESYIDVFVILISCFIHELLHGIGFKIFGHAKSKNINYGISLEKGIIVKLVHTVVVTKTITLFNKDNEKISKRKSPKKGCIYDLFSELTGIYHILLRENFTLEVLLIDITEQRIRTEEPVQSKNNRRRFKKNWNKTNKHLDQIIETITFNKKEDYINLLPKNLPEEFCAKDINKLLKENNSIPKNYRPNGNLIIWVFNRMEIIEQTKVENRSRYYKIKKKV